MRGKLRIVVVVTALVLGLAGCGAREQQKDTAEGQSKADAVIQNVELSSEEGKKAFLKAHTESVLTEHCLYTEYDDDGNDVIIQMDYEGNEQNRFPINEEENCETLVCGSDKRLILSKYVGDEEDIEITDLYSVPVVQTEEGETVQWEQEEKIGSCYDGLLEFSKAVLCEPYLLYIECYKENHNTLVRLDLETGEQKKFTFPLADLDLYYPAYIEDYLYLVNTKDIDFDKGSENNAAVYRIDIAQGSLEKLYESEKQEEDPCILFVDGQFLYQVIENDAVEDRIECFDLKQKKTVGQLSVEEIKRLIREEVMSGSVEECWEFILDGLSVYAGRLYIMPKTSWLTEKGGDGEAAIPETVLLSCSAKDMTDLKYEQDFEEWLQKQDCDKMMLGLGTAGKEDGYYFVYDSYDEVHEQRNYYLMRYHLDTKQIEEVDKKELIWQLYYAFD